MHFSSSKTGKKYQRNILSSNSSLRTSWKNTLEIIHVCDKKEPRLVSSFIFEHCGIFDRESDESTSVYQCVDVVLLVLLDFWLLLSMRVTLMFLNSINNGTHVFSKTQDIPKWYNNLKLYWWLYWYFFLNLNCVLTIIINLKLE